MIVSLGNDHAGHALRDHVRRLLTDLGVEVIDHGCFDTTPVDFPDIAQAVCGDIASGRAQRGVLIGGTGVGASIAANKVPGIRAAVIHDCHCAHQGVEHDDMNVLCIGAKIVGAWLAEDIIRTYLAARFDAKPEHVRRIEKLRLMESAPPGAMPTLGDCARRLGERAGSGAAPGLA